MFLYQWGDSAQSQPQQLTTLLKLSQTNEQQHRLQSHLSHIQLHHSQKLIVATRFEQFLLIPKIVKHPCILGYTTGFWPSALRNNLFEPTDKIMGLSDQSPNSSYNGSEPNLRKTDMLAHKLIKKNDCPLTMGNWLLKRRGLVNMDSFPILWTEFG